MDQTTLFVKAARLLQQAQRVTVFTGAGISVESDIPDFRGPHGLWSKYDPEIFEISYFRKNPEAAWKLFRDQLYAVILKAKPNLAHQAVAQLETQGLVKKVITQNIDGLHQAAGSKQVLEFHGTFQTLICMQCRQRYLAKNISLEILPPVCADCQGVLKPDFVFFGEGIPEPTRTLSFQEAARSDSFLVIGTSGAVMPACMIPLTAKREHGASIVEINIVPSSYTHTITDCFLQGPATRMMDQLLQSMESTAM